VLEKLMEDMNNNLKGLVALIKILSSLLPMEQGATRFGREDAIRE
jgi:hypothetical protein